MTYPFLIRGPTRYARVKMVKIEAGNFRHAMLKAFALYPVKFVNFKFARNMDLISAKQDAKKASMDGKERFVVAHKDQECTIEFNEPSRIGDTLMAIFLKGKEVKEGYNAAPQKVTKREKPAASEDEVIEQAEKENKNINKSKNKTMKKEVKKAAAKKSAPATVTGEKKTLTVAAILALQKKGMRVYRQANPTPGGILINKRLKEYANKEKQIAVIVAKAA